MTIIEKLIAQTEKQYHQRRRVMKRFTMINAKDFVFTADASNLAVRDSRGVRV
jgi:hypothetical protein